MSQPPPKKTDTPEVWPLVVADVLNDEHGTDAPDYFRQKLASKMFERDAFGRSKHGVSLQVENGRDALVDAFEEALDLCVYTRQEYERNGDGAAWRLHSNAVHLAHRLLHRLEMRDAGL